MADNAVICELSDAAAAAWIVMPVNADPYKICVRWPLDNVQLVPRVSLSLDSLSVVRHGFFHFYTIK